MIVFSQLGKPWMGNLGNQLFQIASTIGIAEKNGLNFAFPRWEYMKCFIGSLPIINDSISYTPLKELSFEYHDYQLVKANYDILGFFQSESYFSKEIVKKYLSFAQDLNIKINELFQKKSFRDPILISVRRGDFVHNPKYHQLDYKYYFLALMKYFPDWEERSVIVISDDIQYCKRIFSSIKNFHFFENHTPIEQLVFSTRCKDFIISNSTFSWWAAYFGESRESQVIRPIANFRGKFARMNSHKSYYPERWISFQPRFLDYGLIPINVVLKGEFLNFLTFINFLRKRVIKNLKSILRISSWF